MKASELTVADVGREVVLRGVVVEVRSDGFYPVRLKVEGDQSVWLGSEAEAELGPRPWAIGDKFQQANGNFIWTITAIDADGWVLAAMGGGRASWSPEQLNSTTRLPAPEETADVG